MENEHNFLRYIFPFISIFNLFILKSHLVYLIAYVCKLYELKSECKCQLCCNGSGSGSEFSPLKHYLGVSDA